MSAFAVRPDGSSASKPPGVSLRPESMAHSPSLFHLYRSFCSAHAETGMVVNSPLGANISHFGAGSNPARSWNRKIWAESPFLKQDAVG